jgi:hypothetical protein
VLFVLDDILSAANPRQDLKETLPMKESAATLSYALKNISLFKQSKLAAMEAGDIEYRCESIHCRTASICWARMAPRAKVS